MMPWCPNRSLTATWQFLHSINSTVTLQHPWTSLPRCVNDHNIMDNIINHLPNANTSATNNVWLYLCIFFLSEITNASGTTILPHAMQSGPQQSGSTVNWPWQPMLPPEEWKQWQWAIQALYLCTDSDCLTTLLKKWTATFNKDWKWEWCINPATLELYQWSGSQWFQCQPAIIQWTYIAYGIHGQQHAKIDPNKMPPATPSYDTSQTYIVLQLPLQTAILSVPMPLRFLLTSSTGYACHWWSGQWLYGTTFAQQHQPMLCYTFCNSKKLWFSAVMPVWMQPNTAAAPGLFTEIEPFGKAKGLSPVIVMIHTWDILKHLDYLWLYCSYSTT